MRNQDFKTTVRVACALALIGVTPAYAIEHITNYIPEAEKVGEGRLTYLLWDVYDATLYASEGAWKEDSPFALELIYLREIKGKKIADRSIEEMRNQGITDEIKLATWHTQMSEIFPDVDKGIGLTGIQTDDGTTVFYQDQKELGRIEDKEFSKAFFDIWLSENTSAPDLRRKLLGSL